VKASTSKALLPTPSKLFDWYEKGELTRKQWLAAMSLHFDDVIHEIQEDARNPILAKLETVLATRASKKLLHNTTETELREVLLALAELDDFPPANLLWNADQWDIPLHCFIRQRREPIFRINNLNITRNHAKITLQHGSSNKKQTTHETIRLQRNYLGQLILETRETK